LRTCRCAERQTKDAVQRSPKPKVVVRPGVFAAEAELEPNQIQDLGELIPELFKLKAKANLNMKFHVRFEAGNESQPPDQGVIDDINKLLEGVQEGFELKKYRCGQRHSEQAGPAEFPEVPQSPTN